MEWEYGDYPYGLEPLVMPHARCCHTAPPFDLPSGHSPARAAEALRLSAAEGLEQPPSDETLHWFRWITGHQITFLLWYLMGELVKDIGEEKRADGSTLDSLESYTQGYSAMLLYTGSFSPEAYQALIRPRMHLQHRGFSGMWAADFAPLRRLLRGRDLVWMTDPSAARLAAAISRNRATHELIAARLVPSGKSLLQQMMTEAVTTRPTARTAAIFDSFFMTLRAPVGRDAVVGQLLHRLRAVGLDLAANELPKPESDGAAETEDRIAEILLQVVASVVSDNDRLEKRGAA